MDRLGGAYVIPARVDYFDMLESLRKESKGAVGIAMLNYCGSSCNVRKKLTFVDYRPTALVPEHPFPKQLRQTIAAMMPSSTCWI
jgi:hypothetical protein